jgi:hypothetical protein
MNESVSVFAHRARWRSSSYLFNSYNNKGLQELSSDGTECTHDCITSDERNDALKEDSTCNNF